MGSLLKKVRKKIILYTTPALLMKFAKEMLWNLNCNREGKA